MPLPLTVSCFSKIQIGFTFLVPAHLGSPGKRAVKRVCVCVKRRKLGGNWSVCLYRPVCVCLSTIIYSVLKSMCILNACPLFRPLILWFTRVRPLTSISIDPSILRRFRSWPTQRHYKQTHHRRCAVYTAIQCRLHAQRPNSSISTASRGQETERR